MAGPLSEDEVIDLLVRLRDRCGSLRELSRHLGVSLGHLSELVNRKVSPGPVVLGKLGLRAVVVYERDPVSASSSPTPGEPARV